MPEEVLARLLRDLGVKPGQIPAGPEERAALYRTRLADRRVLIVLDDARDAAQVRPLLPGSASCAVIVTSRHRLADLAGSRLVDLDVLDDDEARGLLTAHHRRGAGRGRARPGARGAGRLRGPAAGDPDRRRAAGRPPRLGGQHAGPAAGRPAAPGGRADRRATWPCGPASTSASTALRQPATGDGVDPAHAFALLGVWQGAAISLQAAAALLGQPEDPVADALEILVDAHLLESPGAGVVQRSTTCCAPTRPSGRRPRSRRRTVNDAVARILRWYLRTADAAAGVVAPYRDRVPLGPATGRRRAALRHRGRGAGAGARQERANLVAATRQAAAIGLHDVAWKLPVAAHGLLRPARLPHRVDHHAPGGPVQRAGGWATGTARPGC